MTFNQKTRKHRYLQDKDAIFKGYVKHFEDESSWSDKSKDDVEATASELELGKGMFGMEFEVRAGM